MDRDNHALILQWQMHWKYVCFSSLHWQKNLMYNSTFLANQVPLFGREHFFYCIQIIANYNKKESSLI